MAFIVNDMRRLLTLKIKEREDDYVDQYCRIFIVKICLVAGLITGFDYFYDRVACIYPGTSTFVLQPNFVPSACWIQGFYIYEELAQNGDNSGYYGIPSNLQHNGMKPDGTLCITNSPSTGKCTPMTKVFYMHYQFIPFYISGVAMVLYLPYLFFMACNNDIKNLKCDLKALGKSTDAECLLKTYFNPSWNSKLKMRLRVVGSVMVRMAYLAVNLVSFRVTDAIFYDRFYDYGWKWAHWAKIRSSQRYEEAAVGGPNPGNRLVPTMGLCDIHESALDERFVLSNRSKFVCELSPHLLYQFSLLIFWFVLVAGIGVAGIGVIHRISSYLVSAHYTYRKSKKSVLSVVSLREMEYLGYIRSHSLALYGDALRKLQLARKNRPDDSDAEPLTAKDSYL